MGEAVYKRPLIVAGMAIEKGDATMRSGQELPAQTCVLRFVKGIPTT
jgi:hypothetical protein